MVQPVELDMELFFARLCSAFPTDSNDTIKSTLVSTNMLRLRVFSYKYLQPICSTAVLVPVPVQVAIENKYLEHEAQVQSFPDCNSTSTSGLNHFFVPDRTADTLLSHPQLHCHNWSHIAQPSDPGEDFEIAVETGRFQFGHLSKLQVLVLFLYLYCTCLCPFNTPSFFSIKQKSAVAGVRTDRRSTT